MTPQIKDKAHPQKNLSETLFIPLDRTTARELKAHAKARGVRTTTLIRMWVLERLQDNLHRPAGA